MKKLKKSYELIGWVFNKGYAENRDKKSPFYKMVLKGDLTQIYEQLDHVYKLGSFGYRVTVINGDFTEHEDFSTLLEAERYYYKKILESEIVNNISFIIKDMESYKILKQSSINL